jgi:hypothetical protein
MQACIDLNDNESTNTRRSALAQSSAAFLSTTTLSQTTTSFRLCLEQVHCFIVSLSHLATLPQSFACAGMTTVFDDIRDLTRQHPLCACGVLTVATALSASSFFAKLHNNLHFRVLQRHFSLFETINNFWKTPLRDLQAAVLPYCNAGESIRTF